MAIIKIIKTTIIEKELAEFNSETDLNDILCRLNKFKEVYDTKSSVWANWKNETARVIKSGGICLSFGWSSQGLGKNRGFKIIEILLVAHGGNHNDTICVVEKKIQKTLIEYK